MKKYNVEFYITPKKPEEKMKYLGSIVFLHTATQDHPVARKTFQLGGIGKIDADRLVITQVR